MIYIYIYINIYIYIYVYIRDESRVAWGGREHTARNLGEMKLASPPIKQNNKYIKQCINNN